MAEIEILPDNVKVDIKEDETVLEGSLSAGIPHAHACGGNAACSTCRVVILEGSDCVLPRTKDEKSLAESLHFNDNIRLACQTRVKGYVKFNRPVLDDIDEALTNKLTSQGSASSRIGEEKNVAVLFADIESYTPFAESLPPYDVIHVLDRYFYLIGNVIKKNNGRIIDYYGDGVLAIFGVNNVDNCALSAVRAGKDMFDSLKKLNPYLERMYDRGFNIRVGIHYGKVIIGTIGIEDSRKFTAIGDSVNFASRIESANKEHGTRFLVSEAAYKQVANKVTVGKEVSVEVKGKSGKHTLYEIVDISA